ncbi:MAG TPA: YigZ family protein [Lachnospiraceae bacterium]|nr:YigZ family protein [Lachnospiraceae bacterium]
MKTVKVLYKGGQGEIEEKKSRFIATLMPVSTEEEAQDFINGMKKKFWDARHNCSAFVIGDNAELTRCSDDGEPSGTAGRPMLEILKGSGVRNAAVVVTRYFGGVLLGTGGLVRAYGDAVKAGLENCVVIERTNGVLCYLKTDYALLAKLLHILETPPFVIKEAIYEERVEFMVLVPEDELKEAEKRITEASGAKAELVPKALCTYARAGEELIVAGERPYRSTEAPAG